MNLIKEIDEGDINEPLKNVVRKATENDKKRYIELEEKSKKDIFIVREKVKKLELEMNLFVFLVKVVFPFIILNTCAQPKR